MALTATADAVSHPEPGAPAWTGSVHLDGWTAGGAGTSPVVEPASGEVLGAVGMATPDDVDHAVPVVARAAASWQDRTSQEREACLRAVAAALDRRRAELAGWLIRESGATRAKADREIARAIAEIDHAIELAATPAERVVHAADDGRRQVVRRVPVGVVGVITPFNAPLVLAIRAIAPALAMGNGVILKPDPRTAAAGGLVLAELACEAGLPRDLLAVLPGDGAVGGRISAHEGIGSVLFTGSTAVGRQVGAAAGGALSRVGLELGGNNPVVVLDDADIDRAARCALTSSFLHQGQICMSAGRFVVQRAVYEPFVERLAELAAALTLGDPWRHEVDMGPMIDEEAAGRVRRLMRHSVTAGAELRCGGGGSGVFVPATVLAEAGPDTPAYAEEIFGPVAAVTPAEDAEHALELASAGEYGLVAAIHTRDETRAHALAAKLSCGTVRVNDVTNHDDPATPMSGWHASGNGSAFGGVEMLELVTLPKLVSVAQRH
ncbi:aldehyde dehydrogenase family protein [Haloechinothrix sp. YIM 98757]|uniref:Aldehyde dehydrogenase family protein n=1 Tax=Haloechinothrix aidingensis TaxID=2752311 RepID=A0A838A9G0_9PSEU|nr:aldehyde dehydrogenase family protein [Haloechinothrix aidingensis]MBA0126178.1 aldehyde dehydrogenase family protein [Haloechinothrix aidingensis]